MAICRCFQLPWEIQEQIDTFLFKGFKGKAVINIATITVTDIFVGIFSAGVSLIDAIGGRNGPICVTLPKVAKANKTKSMSH
jgi:hypothetical protein